MNTPHVKTLLIAGFLSSTAPLAFATPGDNPSPVVQTKPVVSPDVKRVTEASVKQEQTANDFIHKNVFDQNGKAIGFITDISLQGITPLEKKTDVKDSPSVSQKDEGSATTPSSISYVFLSVGGFLGIGDDLIRLPLNALEYQSDRDRFVLNSYLKSEIEAITKNQPGNPGLKEPTALKNGSTYRNNHVWDDYESVKSIQAALRSDKELKEDQKSKVSVRLENDKIKLSGTVGSEQLRKKAGRIAAQHTALEVVNEIAVAQ